MFKLIKFSTKNFYFKLTLLFFSYFYSVVVLSNYIPCVDNILKVTGFNRAPKINIHRVVDTTNQAYGPQLTIPNGVFEKFDDMYLSLRGQFELGGVAEISRTSGFNFRDRRVVEVTPESYQKKVFYRQGYEQREDKNWIIKKIAKKLRAYPSLEFIFWAEENSPFNIFFGFVDKEKYVTLSKISIDDWDSNLRHFVQQIVKDPDIFEENFNHIHERLKSKIARVPKKHDYSYETNIGSIKSNGLFSPYIGGTLVDFHYHPVLSVANIDFDDYVSLHKGDLDAFNFYFEKYGVKWFHIRGAFLDSPGKYIMSTATFYLPLINKWLEELNRFLKYEFESLSHEKRIDELIKFWDQSERLNTRLIFYEVLDAFYKKK